MMDGTFYSLETCHVFAMGIFQGLGRNIFTGDARLESKFMVDILFALGYVVLCFNFYL